MSSYLQELPLDEVVNLSDPENEFKVAISVEDYYSQKMKNSGKYLKWIFKLYIITDGVLTEKMLGTHKCTEEDYGKFYPIQDS